MSDPGQTDVLATMGRTVASNVRRVASAVCIVGLLAVAWVVPLSRQDVTAWTPREPCCPTLAARASSGSSSAAAIVIAPAGLRCQFQEPDASQARLPGGRAVFAELPAAVPLPDLALAQTLPRLLQ